MSDPSGETSVLELVPLAPVVLQTRATRNSKMTAKITIPTDASTEQLHIIIGTLYLSLTKAVEHIERTENLAAVNGFKDRFLTALKSGDIDMSLLDDAKTFDLVVSIIEGAMDVKESVSSGTMPLSPSMESRRVI